MGDLDNKESKTVCNSTEMSNAVAELQLAMAALVDAFERASTLSVRFAADYEGEATGEVIVFLNNLPIHISRLIMLYDKMAQFILVTIQAFQVSDTLMVQNMGNQ